MRHEDLPGLGSAAERDADLDRALKQIMQVSPALEDDVLGELDLRHRPLIVELAQGAFAGTEARRQAGFPEAGALPQDALVKTVGDGVQQVEIGAADNRVVLHTKRDAGPPQFLLDVGMAVHEAVHREREVGCDTQAHRPHDRVQHVEIVT